MSLEAMKQALEALENVYFDRPEEHIKRIITSLRKAIAEAEKAEPVAFASHGVVNWIADKQFQHEAELYTSPPQRQWVGLTDEEIFVELERVDPQAKRLPAGLKIFAHYLEARLREKNTPQDGKCKYCTNGCVACDARKLPNVLF